MNFTPELSFEGGRLRPLAEADVDALMAIYQQPELPGQHPAQDPQPVRRMIELSVQMAATQRGMMWALEVESSASGESGVLGLVSAYDWQPSQLRIMLRADGLPEMEGRYRVAALKAVMDFMAQKYHLRNFGYQWIEGQNEALKTVLEEAGFAATARLRDGWRIDEQAFADVHQYHCLRSEACPVAGRLGEQDNPGQNLDRSFFAESDPQGTDSPEAGQ